MRILGGSRGLVPGFGGPRGGDALDRALADMVTLNPALALRWYDKVGSIEACKVADLLLLRRSATARQASRPVSGALLTPPIAMSNSCWSAASRERPIWT